MLTVVFTGFSVIPAETTLRGRRIFGLRSAGACQDSDSNQDDDPDADPHLRNAQEEGGDGQSDDQNNESDQVGTE